MTAYPKRVCVVRLTEDAGDLLLSALSGLRKLVVGDRHWRIVWRVTEDTDGTPILDIFEVWAIGDRSDSEIFEELKVRVERIGADPKQM